MSDLALEVDELVVQAIEYGAQTEQQVQTYVNDRLALTIPIAVSYTHLTLPTNREV